MEVSEKEKPLDTVLDMASTASHVCSTLLATEPLPQSKWLTTRWHSHRVKPHHSPIPVRVYNRLFPLSDAPTEKPVESVLVKGDSLLRNMEIRDSIRHYQCVQRVRMPGIRANFKVLAYANVMG